ncbi:MAG TPA: ribonuclease P protein subunit [Candidatus Nitrosocosmicus sp.]|nr:ribonuclease P protein subunit [Candidatus Nitrosocosmicus sp.]
MGVNRDLYENMDGKLLNLPMKIIKSSNPQNNGKNGKVVNITKNIIVLKGNCSDSIIKIPKKEISKYSITTKHRIYILPGKRLLGRPEEVKSKS